MPASRFKHTFSWKSAPLYFGLLALSLIYESLVLLRLFLYQSGILRSNAAGCPVISVGNLTVGGAGKTPVVDFLVKEIVRQHKTCAVLSRGYGNQAPSSIQRILLQESPHRNPKMIGDEPYLLATKNPTVPIYVGKNRVLGAVLAKRWDNPEFLILDDGYQHLQLKRTLNLLLIDAERGLGNGHLLPLGALREPPHHWQRADAILLTKSNLGFSDRVLHQLKKLQVTCPIFHFQYHPQGIRRLDGQQFIAPLQLAHKRVLLSCGIAQPDGFALTLKQLKADVVGLEAFGDHFSYSPKNITPLLQKKAVHNPDFWITTEKDAVKLQAYPELSEALWVLEMHVTADAAWQEFFIDFLKQNGLD